MANHSKFALPHAECRRKVCFVCFGRCDAKRFLHTNPGLQESISKLFKISFGKEEDAIDLDDVRVPIGICNPCYLKVRKASPKLELVHRDFTFVLDVSPSGTSCQCMICQIAKNKVSNLIQFQGRIRKKINKPTSSVRCDNCQSIIGKGLKHHCTYTTVVENELQILNDPSNGNLGGAVVSSFIKEAPSSPDGTVRLPQVSGRPLPVKTYAASQPSPKPQVSTFDLMQLQIDNCFGDAQIRNIATFINGIFGRGAVESYFQEKLSFAYKYFEDDFSFSTTTFSTNGKTPSLYESTLVHVNCLSSFIQKVFSERSLNYQDYDVKLGID